MHGLGNDFVIIDARVDDVPMTSQIAASIADRKTGIGCDQLIVLRPSKTSDVQMQIYNSDGGEVESCGNASRCVVKLLGEDITIETAGGLISGQVTASGTTVDMGQPKTDWQSIPLAYAMDCLHMPVGWDDLIDPVSVNVGNPHVVFFVDDRTSVKLDLLGPIIETDPLFPERVNVNVAHVANGELHLAVWERGVGLTRACGTGACATAVAAIQRQLVSSPVKVHLPGGELTISWEPGQSILMQGPTSYVFSGEADWDAFR